MSRTITAMFDSRSEAESARQRLTASNIDADRVRIIDKDGSGGSYGNTAEDTEGKGFWAQMKELFVTEEDRHSYAEGVSRGGFLLSAEVDEDEADRACQLLEQSSSVDFESREKQWRSDDGWTGFAGAGTPMRGTSYGATSAGTSGFSDTTSERGRTVSEEHVPIVDEELRVGKREVSRGGVKVRSYVKEVPVHEQVSLREEHVDVERRPVNRSLNEAGLTGDAFQEKNFEMTETSEEAVVAKDARVREELVVKKTAEEHVENIDETVRHTEVDVDGADNRSAFGGFDKDRQRATDTTRGTADTDFERTDRDRGF